MKPMAYGDTLIFEVKDIETVGQDRFSYNSPDEEGVITSSFVRVNFRENWLVL